MADEDAETTKNEFTSSSRKRWVWLSTLVSLTVVASYIAVWAWLTVKQGPDVVPGAMNWSVRLGFLLFVVWIVGDKAVAAYNELTGDGGGGDDDG